MERSRFGLDVSPISPNNNPLETSFEKAKKQTQSPEHKKVLEKISMSRSPMSAAKVVNDVVSTSPINRWADIDVEEYSVRNSFTLKMNAMNNSNMSPSGGSSSSFFPMRKDFQSHRRYIFATHISSAVLRHILSTVSTDTF